MTQQNASFFNIRFIESRQTSGPTEVSGFRQFRLEQMTVSDFRMWQLFLQCLW